MTSTRAVAYVGCALLLLAWLAAAAADPQRPRTTKATPQQREDARVMTLARDVQAQAARLRQRLAVAPAPDEPVRNPFTFGARAMPAVNRTPALTAPPALDEPRVPVEPALSLVGVAEQQTPDGVVRTAMITTGNDDLLMVTAGQAVGSAMWS